MDLLIQISIYLLSFVLVWYGSDLIVRSVSHFSNKLRISSFSISFFILGLLTSLPEFALGLTALTSGTPDIFVGNLIGGIIIIFLFILPSYAVLGKSIRISHDLDRFSLIFTLSVIATPALIILDGRVTTSESLILILLYLALFYVIESKRGLLSSNNLRLANTKSYSLKDVVRLMVGIFMVFISSHYIVNQTLAFSKLMQIPPLIISILVLSIGTNLPEISLGIKSIISGNRDIAFGNYMGSAAANVFLLGFFSLLNRGEVITSHNFPVNFLFTISATALFYHFSRSKNNISINEGVILLILYFLYICYWLIFP